MKPVRPVRILLISMAVRSNPSVQLKNCEEDDEDVDEHQQFLENAFALIRDSAFTLHLRVSAPRSNLDRPSVITKTVAFLARP